MSLASYVDFAVNERLISGLSKYLHRRRNTKPKSHVCDGGKED
jgi:hypothetical protein